MYGNMPRVLFGSKNQRQHRSGTLDIKYALCWRRNGQHSKTQNPMWKPGEHVRIDRGEQQFEGDGEVAYSAAKRIAKLAAVVSLAQTCAGGNQSALKNTNSVTMKCTTSHHAHDMRTQGQQHPTKSPVSHSVVRVSGQRHAGQTR